MKIAIASGKGGTGKTLVATNLADTVSRQADVVLLDLDVEEPNCHLFFDAQFDDGDLVRTMIPVVNRQQCSHCGVCGDVCEYNAIVNVPTDVLVFPELCHSCYGCLEMCPERAITEGFKVIGRTFVAHLGSLVLVSGCLEIGEPATTSVVTATKKRAHGLLGVAGSAASQPVLQIYDSPPGTSCPVIEAVRDANYVVLVAEPTRFGLHDLDLMVNTLRLLGKPFGVVANKAVDGDCAVEDMCREQGVDVVARLALSRDVAGAYARGELVAETVPGMREQFVSLLERLLELVQLTVGGEGGGSAPREPIARSGSETRETSA